MRFFFNVIEGTTEFPDPEGTELPDEATAQSEAMTIVRCLRDEFPERFLEDGVLEVITENGRRIMALPIITELVMRGLKHQLSTG